MNDSPLHVVPKNAYNHGIERTLKVHSLITVFVDLLLFSALASSILMA